MPVSSEKIHSNLFLRMHPLHRIVVSFILSAIAYFIFPEDEYILIRIISLWIVFSSVYLIMSWITFFTKPISDIKRTAAKDDGSAPYVFLMILLSSFGSMFTVLLLLISKNVTASNSAFFVPATVCGMLLSWAMVHTLYAFHYAHNFYLPHEKDKTKSVEGLDFPGKEEPDYIDFAYFAFVIGCTFQVSDVEISSRKIRRLALGHQLISFGLNTFVVALTINLIASLSK